MVARYNVGHCECGKLNKLEPYGCGKYMRYKDYEELLARMGETKIMKRSDIKTQA